MQMPCVLISRPDNPKSASFVKIQGFFAHFANMRRGHAATHCSLSAQGACSLYAPRVDSHSRRRHTTDINDLASANRLFQLCFFQVLALKSGFDRNQLLLHTTEEKLLTSDTALVTNAASLNEWFTKSKRPKRFERCFARLEIKF